MENKNVLITGATGNIGLEVIRGLNEINAQVNIIAGSHSVEKAKITLSGYDVSAFRKVDFTDSASFLPALQDVDVVFLLRPPQLADVPQYFTPFIRAMKEKGIPKIVFLSVQGAESQRYIPHYKIEKLIMEEQLDYVFLRPGYFMQNLTSALKYDIINHQKIAVPSGNLKFNWVDARDVGLTAAYILNDFGKYRNMAYEITGSEFVGFNKAAAVLSRVLGETICYKSTNLLSFIFRKRKQGVSMPMILVMIMLHYLPRFGKNQSRLTSTVTDITGRQPGTIHEFVEREKENLM